jgi:hypothetical protein
MVDADHKDDTGGFVDANQYAIVTPAGAAIVPEFVGEWLAEPGRIVSNRSSDEFDDRGRDLGGQPL